MIEREQMEPEQEPLFDGEVRGLSQTERKAKVIVTEAANIYISRKIEEFGYLELQYFDDKSVIAIGQKIVTENLWRFLKPKTFCYFGRLDFKPSELEKVEGDWLLDVYGDKNLQKMEEFATVLSRERGVSIEVRLQDRNEREWKWITK